MVRLEHVTKIYNVQDSNAYRALNDISLCIEDGEMIAIIGKSGAGKSTLLHILACIDTYNEGEYYLDDELIRAMSGNQMARIRNEQIGLVMQDYALVEDYSVLDNVLLPLDFSTRKKRGKKQLAIDALESVSMGEYASKRAAKLSGGQKQRVAIARAIVNDPKLILADEPTGALDSGTTEEIMKLFHSLHEKSHTIVIVTHDMDIAKQCDRMIELADGCIVTQ
ncbi:MAG TPA: ABC transporter ATP-binding protein [Lachnospiraceae bacterium]|nr:ABC transporter ATP-binding protein [Lachnospiraceae bacterium]